MQVFPLDKIIS